MRKYVLWLCVPLFCLCACVAEKEDSIVADTLEHGVLQQASENLTKKPITITSFIAERSQGDKHDFYSEGDYWWPDSTNLSGPYVRRDGQTNPDNFVAHRKAMIEFSSVVGNLTSAYLFTKDRKYADAVIAHLYASFASIRPGHQRSGDRKGHRHYRHGSLDGSGPVVVQAGRRGCPA